MSELTREAEGFLRDLERHLSPLSEAERRDAVAEIRSHLEDRAAQGATDLLAPFGRAEDYAAAFLQERALAGALAGGSSWAIGRALLAGARRLAWWYAVAALWLVQLLGALLAALGVLKIFCPEKVGVFMHGRSLTVGIVEDEGGVEMLGWLSVPAFFAIGVLAIWSAHWFLRTLASWRLSRIRPGLGRAG